MGFFDFLKKKEDVQQLILQDIPKILKGYLALL